MRYIARYRAHRFVGREEPGIDGFPYDMPQIHKLLWAFGQLQGRGQWGTRYIAYMAQQPIRPSRKRDRKVFRAPVQTPVSLATGY